MQGADLVVSNGERELGSPRHRGSRAQEAVHHGSGRERDEAMSAPQQLEHEDPRQTWATPKWVLDVAQDITGKEIALDVASSDDNAVASRNFCRTKDGLTQSWECNGDEQMAWCNPPYGDIGPWVRKAVVELGRGNPSCLLLPVRAATSWFSVMVGAMTRGRDVGIRFFRHRVNFVPPAGVKSSSNAEASMLVFFGCGVSGADVIHGRGK